MSFIGSNGNNNPLFQLGGVQQQPAQSQFNFATPGVQQQAQFNFNQQPQAAQAPFNFGQPQQPQQYGMTAQSFNLLGPVNANLVDGAVTSSVTAILMSIKNDIDKIIVKLLQEHNARRPDIEAIFAGVDFQGCFLDVIYKKGESMCPSFNLSKQLRAGAVGGVFGGGLGQGLSVNGAIANTGSTGNPYAADGTIIKMNEIVKAFNTIADILSKVNIAGPFEIRTVAANINYISTTGMLILTPSTLILNDNKNDARKLSTKI